MTDLVAAWAAGIVDGEGCITIKRNGSYYFLTVIVGQSGPKVPPMIKKLKAVYGGNVGRPAVDKRRNRRPKWTWQIVCEGAESFLVAIFPHLVEKKRQARLALKYRTFVGKPGTRRTPRERRAVERLYRLLRAEKNYTKVHEKWKVRDV